MKRIVKRRTEITIETYEITTVRSHTADVVAYGHPDDTEGDAFTPLLTSGDEGPERPTDETTSDQRFEIEQSNEIETEQ